MADPRAKRVAKEIADIQKDTISDVYIDTIDDSPYHLKGSFPGPEGSPYEDGFYEVDIEVPPNYPFSPMKMKFITKVYHPNISSASGYICLDILNKAWSPVLTLKSALISLRSLLVSPEPSDPQDAEVAKHFIRDRKDAEKTARYWAETYAQDAKKRRTGLPPKRGETDPIKAAGLEEKHVKAFEAMGFPQDKVIATLKKLNYRGDNVKNVSEDAVLNALFD